jgi:hypothetical protein
LHQIYFIDLQPNSEKETEKSATLFFKHGSTVNRVYGGHDGNKAIEKEVYGRHKHKKVGSHATHRKSQPQNVFTFTPKQR